MTRHCTLLKLYLLLTNTDGSIDPKELRLGERMMSLEGVDSTLFYSYLRKCASFDRDKEYDECIKALKHFTQDIQIRYIAWLSLVANADGFIDNEEWSFIYKLYNDELGLSIVDIMPIQRQLKDSITNKVYA